MLALSPRVFAIAEHHADRHRSYLYEPDSFRPLALLEGFGPKDTQPFHYQLDHLGTPQELTAPDSEIVWSAHYHAYGEISRLDVSKIDNPLRFQGQYFDPESGLHYNSHRYYNPDIGRYLTPDPMKLAGGINAYQYVPNPTGWVDPLGLNTCPGGDGCKPVTGLENPIGKAQVNERQLTAPQTSREQRRERFYSISDQGIKMLFHPFSEHIPFDASLYYFVGVFDIYDREETKGAELHAYDPNEKKDRENLILKYCLDPYNKLSYRHRYKLMENLDAALNTENLDFHCFFEDAPDKYSTMAWDETEIVDPQSFFADIYRLANEVWKDDLQRASLEDPSTW